MAMLVVIARFVIVMGGELIKDCYIVLVIAVIRHETTAAARWALLLVVGASFNDAIAVAIRASLHLYLPSPSFVKHSRNGRPLTRVRAAETTRTTRHPRH
jgi:hypothetical protein